MKWVVGVLACALAACGNGGKSLVVHVSNIPAGTVMLQASASSFQYEATRSFASAALVTGAASFAIAAPSGDDPIEIVVEAHSNDCVIARGAATCDVGCAAVELALPPAASCAVPDGGLLDQGREDASPP